MCCEPVSIGLLGGGSLLTTALGVGVLIVAAYLFMVYVVPAVSVLLASVVGLLASLAVLVAELVTLALGVFAVGAVLVALIEIVQFRKSSRAAARLRKLESIESERDLAADALFGAFPPLLDLVHAPSACQHPRVG